MMALEQITFNIGAFNDANAGGNNYYAGLVFEVKNQSDNTFATIYSDASGSTQIPQNGIDNVSNSIGECNFYIDDGVYYVEVDSSKKPLSVSSEINPVVQSAVDRTENIDLKSNILKDNTNPAYDNAVVLQRTGVDKTTRVYIMPNGEPSGNVPCAVKIFRNGQAGGVFDDDYEDFNVSWYNVLNGGAVGNDESRAVLLNMKTGQDGIYKGNASDVVFGFDDMLSGDIGTPSANIAGRMYQHTNGSQAYCGWIFGKGTKTLSLTDDIAFFEKFVGLANGQGFRFEGGDGVGDSTLKFDTDNILKLSLRGNGDVFTWNQKGRFTQKIKNCNTYAQSYSASLTPNIENGSYQKVFVTGDMAVSSILNAINGDEITLHLTCDASIRTVTFAAGFKMDSDLVASNEFALTPSKTTIIKLRSDGTAFFQQSKAITIG